MKIRIITNGNQMYLAPKSARLPAGNFEIGPRDGNGVRHIHGIYWVDYIHEPRKQAEETIPSLPASWLVK